MNRRKSAKKGLVFGGINYFINFIFPFVVRTIIIKTLGDAYVGLGSLFSSILNVLNVTELGLGTALCFLLYQPLADKNTNRVRAILNFSRKSFFVVGITILALGFAIIPFLNNLIASDIPENLNIYILYSITLVNTSISYMTFSYKRILLSADQRYDIEMKISSLTVVIQYTLQIVLLLVFKNYYLYSIVVLFSTILNNILCQVVTKKKYPDYFPSGKVLKEDVNLIKEKVGGAFLAKLSTTIYLSLDNIIISAFLGLVILGKYNNYYLIIASLISAFAIIHNTIRPIIGNMVITDRNNKNFDRFMMFEFLYSAVSLFCFTCLICLYQDFISDWIGVEKQLSNYTMFLLSISFLVGRLSCVISIYIDALGLWKSTKWVYLSAAVFNLIFNILFAKLWGIDGILYSTIISSFFITFLGTAFLLFKKYFNNSYMVRKYILSTILNYAVGIFISISVYVYMQSFVADNFGLLIIKALVSSSLFVLLYVIIHFQNPLFKKSTQLLKNMFYKR